MATPMLLCSSILNFSCSSNIKFLHERQVWFPVCRLREVVRLWEGPLWEVPLYTYLGIYTVHECFLKLMTSAETCMELVFFQAERYVIINHEYLFRASRNTAQHGVGFIDIIGTIIYTSLDSRPPCSKISCLASHSATNTHILLKAICMQGCLHGQLFSKSLHVVMTRKFSKNQFSGHW